MWVTNFDIIECDELRTDNVVLWAWSVWTTEIADSAITNVKMADDAIKKAELDYELATVTITWAASWTATVVAWGQILGWYVTAITWTESVKTVDISTTTLTVTLTWSDTATVKVMVLKA